MVKSCKWQIQIHPLDFWFFTEDYLVSLSSTTWQNMSPYLHYSAFLLSQLTPCFLCLIPNACRLNQDRIRLAPWSCHHLSLSCLSPYTHFSLVYLSCSALLLKGKPNFNKRENLKKEYKQRLNIYPYYPIFGLPLLAVCL